MKTYSRQRLLFWFGTLLSLTSPLVVAAAAEPAKETASVLAATPKLVLRDHVADYDAELRGKDGRVDINGMVARLKQLGVTTYYWLVWHAGTDWEDLKLFLPVAARANIEVWVYLVPPSESPPQYAGQYSEPFRLDYQRWAGEIAQLSLQHPNLTAWVIDDFYANHELFTPAYLREMQARAKRANPRLAFLPLMYFNEITRQFVEDYHEVIDGVVVAYPSGREEIDYARAILKGETVAMPGQFVCPWNRPSHAGDFASAALKARVLSTNACRLRFREQDDFTGPTEGYHFKQLLVGDNVVWEKDAAGGESGWQEVELDVTPEVRGRTNAVLTFRLLDKKGVSNFGLRWRLRDLRAEGLDPAADFNQTAQWQVSQRGPLEAGFGTPIPVTARRFQIPFIVMTAGDAGEFRLRHGAPSSPERINEWLRMCLQARADGQCDGVVTYCLDKQPDSKVFPMAAQSFKDFKNQLK